MTTEKMGAKPPSLNPTYKHKKYLEFKLWTDVLNYSHDDQFDDLGEFVEKLRRYTSDRRDHFIVSQLTNSEYVLFTKLLQEDDL